MPNENKKINISKYFAAQINNVHDILALRLDFGMIKTTSQYFEINDAVRNGSDPVAAVIYENYKLCITVEQCLNRVTKR